MSPEGGEVWLQRMQAILLEWRSRLPSVSGVTAERSLEVPDGLKDLVTEDFDPVDLISRAAGISQIIKVSRLGADIVVEFEDGSGEPYRAILHQSDPNRWRIRSLKFQCSICFGTGQNDGEECLLCHGAGWGVG